MNYWEHSLNATPKEGVYMVDCKKYRIEKYVWVGYKKMKENVTWYEMARYCSDG